QLKFWFALVTILFSWAFMNLFFQVSQSSTSSACIITGLNVTAAPGDSGTIWQALTKAARLQTTSWCRLILIHEWDEPCPLHGSTPLAWFGEMSTAVQLRFR